MKKVALSACLLGCSCRYDANHNLNEPISAYAKDFFRNNADISRYIGKVYDVEKNLQHTNCFRLGNRIL